MKCPIDGAELVMSERQGIEIDYCPSCRGVWLDRGELDKIIERSEGDSPAAGARPAPQPQVVYAQQPQQAYRHHDDDDYKYKKRKHKSLLGELFDF